MSNPTLLQRQRAYQSLQGWLRDPAVFFTDHLFARMPSLVAQPAYEIGVFRAKYLSVLLDNTTGPVVGYDIFPNEGTERRILGDLAKLSYDIGRLDLVRVDSRDLDPDRVRRDLGGRAAGAISIDGSHVREFVVGDLRLADRTLGDDGFIAYDDFMNAIALGSNEAYYEVMLDRSSPVRLAPFAFVTNKLFLCRPERHGAYFAAAQDFVERHIDQPWMQAIAQRRQRKQHTTEVLTRFDVQIVN